MALLIAVVLVVPATAAVGADLDELLSRSQEATYTATQTVSCSTPDGVRDAVLKITQNGNALTVSSHITDEVEIAAGAGSWSLRSGGDLVSEAAVGAGGEKTEPLYEIAEEVAVEYLGRAAVSYLLIREGSPRAELVFDDETGALVEAVTYAIGGDVYCERSFVSIDTEVPESTESTLDVETEVPVEVEASTLPTDVSGFELLDQYEDADGLRFAYYSDGFFSFGLFETETTVDLPEATDVELESGVYSRLFTAGQVTYVWQTKSGWFALVGDLPPDLHGAVLSEMPHPEDPGFFRRMWRSLFG